MATHQLDALRAQATATIKHGTGLITDLRALTDRFSVLIPEIGEQTEHEQTAEP